MAIRARRSEVKRQVRIRNRAVQEPLSAPPGLVVVTRHGRSTHHQLGMADVQIRGASPRIAVLVGAMAVCRPQPPTRQRGDGVLKDAIPVSELALHLEPQSQSGAWPYAVPTLILDSAQSVSGHPPFRNLSWRFTSDCRDGRVCRRLPSPHPNLRARRGGSFEPIQVPAFDFLIGPRAVLAPRMYAPSGLAHVSLSWAPVARGWTSC